MATTLSALIFPSVEFGAPTASAPGDSSVTGTAATLSHSDHKHAREAALVMATTVVADTTFGGTSIVGTSSNAAREDHGHGSPSLSSTTPSSVSYGGGAVIGTGTTAAKADHAHAGPATPATSVAGRTGAVTLTAPDIGAGTFTGAFTFTGGALALTSANNGIEIGPPGTSNTPFIDFHSSSSSNDYDARIIASGGGASSGLGALTYAAGGGHLFKYGTVAVQDVGLTVMSTTASTGTVNLQPGSTTNAGYVEFYAINGIRHGYIGNGPGASGTTDTGTVYYTSGNHGFAGSVTITPGALTLGNGAGAPGMIINGAAGQARGVAVQSASAYRWYVGTSTAAETGSDTGSDFGVWYWTDAGALVLSVTVPRATGLWSFAKGMQVPNSAPPSEFKATSTNGPISVAYNGATPDNNSYGIVGVTAPAAVNTAYYSMTAAGNIVYGMGIDSLNLMRVGNVATSKAMNANAVSIDSSGSLWTNGGSILAKAGTANYGYVLLNPGGSSNAGYVAFYGTTASPQRHGYIGFGGGNPASIDTGGISYVTGTHSFTGAITSVNSITTSNGSTVVGYQLYDANSGLIAANGLRAVLYAWHGIEIRGGRATSAPTPPAGGGTADPSLSVYASGSATTLYLSGDGTAGRGAEITFNDTKSGQATPSKYIRSYQGQLQVVNSGYTTAILTLTDAGALNTAGNLSENGNRVYSSANPPPASSATTDVETLGYMGVFS